MRRLQQSGYSSYDLQGFGGGGEVNSRNVGQTSREQGWRPLQLNSRLREFACSTVLLVFACWFLKVRVLIGSLGVINEDGQAVHCDGK